MVPNSWCPHPCMTLSPWMWPRPNYSLLMDGRWQNGGMSLQRLGSKSTVSSILLALSCPLVCSLLMEASCPVWAAPWGNSYIKEWGSPPANSSPQGIESYQRPHEWACKQMAFQSSLRVRLQPSQHLDYSLLRGFEAEAHNLVVPRLSWGNLCYSNVQLIR